MWKCSCLIVFVLVVLRVCSPAQLDTINNLLSGIKGQLAHKNDSNCQPEKFYTETFPLNVLIKTDGDHLKTKLANGLESFTLNFAFSYAGRRTSVVTIDPNGVLYLKYSRGEDDFIAPMRSEIKFDEQKSNVEYYQTNEYFLVKWTDLVVDSSNNSLYTVLVIIYESGEILIVYEKLHDEINDNIQIIKSADLKSFEVFLKKIVNASIVYVAECKPRCIEQASLTIHEPTNTLEDLNSTETPDVIINSISDDLTNIPANPETSIPSEMSVSTIEQNISVENHKEMNSASYNSTKELDIENMANKTSMETVNTAETSNPTNIQKNLETDREASVGTLNFIEMIDTDEQNSSADNDNREVNSSIPNREIQNTGPSISKITAAISVDTRRAKTLFEKINSYYKADGTADKKVIKFNIDTFSTDPTIKFNFTFNNVSFDTVTIEKGKILLDAKSQEHFAQIQVEPIPETLDEVITSFDLKTCMDDNGLIILLEKLKIKTPVKTFDSNEIILVFTKSGTIEIIYKNLTNKDINGKTVVLHTLSNKSVSEGVMEFKTIVNGTIARFGTAPKLTDLLTKVKDASAHSIHDVILLEQFYSINIDDNAFVYDNGIVTITSNFSIPFKGKMVQNIYITDRMELYYDTVERNLTIIPKADKFLNFDFKYSITPEYVSLTWSNLQTSNSMYNLRTVVFPTGEILILFKDFKSDKLNHQFTAGSSNTELESGTIVYIAADQIPNIPIKSIYQLKDEIKLQFLEQNSSLIKNIEQFDQFSRATNDFESTEINNSDNVTIDLGFQLCASKIKKSVKVSNMVQLDVDENTKVQIVPHPESSTNSRIKMVRGSDFLSIIWNGLKINENFYNQEMNIFEGGDVFILHKNVTPSSITNKLLNESNDIKLEETAIAYIHTCSVIKPITFEELLAEFTTQLDDCQNPKSTSLDDTKLQTYMTFKPDTTEVVETGNKIRSMQFKSHTIHIDQSIQLQLNDSAKINLVPTDGNSFNIGAVVKSTITEAYLSLTWHNLSVKNGTMTQLPYKQIRAIIFTNGDILVVYDIDQTVSNVFLPGTDEIKLKRGSLIKIDECTLESNSPILYPDLLGDILAEVKSIDKKTTSCVHSVFDVNGKITKNIFAIKEDLQVLDENENKIPMKFEIKNGNETYKHITLLNRTVFYFDVTATNTYDIIDPITGLITDEKIPIRYTVDSEYTSISISLTNVTFNDKTDKPLTVDARALIVPTGEIIIGYKNIASQNINYINETVRVAGAARCKPEPNDITEESSTPGPLIPSPFAASANSIYVTQLFCLVFSLSMILLSFHCM